MDVEAWLLDKSFFSSTTQTVCNPRYQVFICGIRSLQYLFAELLATFYKEEFMFQQPEPHFLFPFYVSFEKSSFVFLS